MAAVARSSRWDPAQRAAPVHLHVPRLDVRDQRCQQRDGDQGKVPPDDAGQGGAHLGSRASRGWTGG